jgi:hypothetical protein
MMTKAADIADVIKAFNALWRSLYAVAPIQIAAKKVPITIRYEFIVSAMGIWPSSISKDTLQVARLLRGWLGFEVALCTAKKKMYNK